MPITAASCFAPSGALPFQDRDQVLLQRRAARRVRQHPLRPMPSKMCRAAKPIRSRPAENIGLAASAPPDGLTRRRRRSSPMASVRISSWWLNGAYSSATSIEPASPPVATLAEAAVDGEVVRSRVPEHRGLDAVLEAGDPGRVVRAARGPGRRRRARSPRRRR